MLLRVLGHKFHYECENLCRMFYPYRDIKVVYDRADDGDNIIETQLIERSESGVCESGKGAEIKLIVSADIDGASVCLEKNVSCPKDSDDCEYEMAVLLFEALKKITGYTPEWGILTGVRPSKLMLRLISSMGHDGAHDYFRNRLFVSEEKTLLTSKVVKREEAIIASSRPDSFSLYVAIPFCPSRCSYCSFVSHSITAPNAKKLVPAYVGKLCDEIRATGKIASSLGLRLESVYFGGGTPTSLSAEDLDLLCTAVGESFNLSSAREYTVEAGRPDTITREKLDALIRNGVGRISINPQTLNDEILAGIGRKHNSAQVIEAFNMAREAGFKNINTDVIAGLSGDTSDSFEYTLNTLADLSPENITVHTLALKRASELVTDGKELLTDADTVSKMLGFAQNKLTESGYMPYYMYRQSKCIGNHENVGWCKEGFDCLYNVFMMEECHTVLAVGAGAVTKLCRDSGKYVERVFNFKYPYEYINRFTELEERKNRIIEFYQS